jgi:hypothetical protein
MPSRRVSRAAGPAAHDASHVAGDQFEAPKNEGAHQNLIQLRIGLHQREQLLVTEFDHFAGFADPQSPPSTGDPKSD